MGIVGSADRICGIGNIFYAFLTDGEQYTDTAACAVYSCA